MSSAAPSLDSSLLSRAVPEGSPRYFAWLYAEEAQRNVLAAVFLIEAELRDSANAPHEVAHVRLQWWQQEVSNLMLNQAQHPATRLLQATSAQHPILQRCSNAVHAAMQDLAGATYENDGELNDYLRRSGGAITAVAIGLLNSESSTELAAAAEGIGAFVRRAETLRDIRNDVHRGRLYLPLGPLDALHISHDDLQRKEWPDSLVTYLRQCIAQSLQDYESLKRNLPVADRHALRPLLVLGDLHAKLLRKLGTNPSGLTQQRTELGPFNALWTAWRAARRAV